MLFTSVPRSRPPFEPGYGPAGKVVSDRTPTPHGLRVPPWQRQAGAGVQRRQPVDQNRVGLAHHVVAALVVHPAVAADIHHDPATTAESNVSPPEKLIQDGWTAFPVAAVLNRAIASQTLGALTSMPPVLARTKKEPSGDRAISLT